MTSRLAAMSTACGGAVDIAGESLVHHQAFLLRVARLQLGRDEDAHDVVQETLAAALAADRQRAEGVPLRAWLLGILRNKIIDVIRFRTRHVPLDPDDDLNPAPSEFDHQFHPDECWKQQAIAGGLCPEGAAVRRQLLDLVELCVAKLPTNTGRVFLMREFLDMEFDEIAGRLQLSAGNLRVLLYRARMRLRDCVSRGWGDFDDYL